jgi:hypothetical protein
MEVKGNTRTFSIASAPEKRPDHEHREHARLACSRFEAASALLERFMVCG